MIFNDYACNLDLMLKKHKGKSQLCHGIFSPLKHKYTKGGLPWKGITNLTLEINTYTRAWMSTFSGRSLVTRHKINNPKNKDIAEPLSIQI
jgi:hypothetical protein